MIAMWLRCGEQFRRRYIEKEIIPPGITARRGSAVHKAAEINHKQKIQTKKDMPLDDLKDATRDTYIHLIKEEGVFIPKEYASEKKKLLNEGLNQALSATEIYSDIVAPQIQPKKVEYTIQKKLDGFDLPLEGKVDVVNETGEVIDLKVKRRESQAWADREIQPSFYTLLLKDEGNYPEFVYQIITPLKTTTNVQTLRTRRTSQDIEILKMYIEAFIRDLETGNFKPCHPENWMCSPLYCGYYYTCKYARR